MPNQTIIEPGREIRFRRTALVEGATEVWVPIFKGRQSAHEFLGYYQARPTLEECKETTAFGDHADGHVATGFAKVRVEVLETAPVIRADDEVPDGH
jgi:hypothetical protein